MKMSQRMGGTAKSFFFVVLVLVAIGGILVLKTSSAAASNSKAAEGVKTLYELANPGTAFEVVTATEESGVYKVLLKSEGPSGTVYSDVYVTKDGKLLAPGVILVENSTEQLQKMKGFVDCLKEKKVLVFGVLNSSFSPQGAATTSLQLQALGMYSGKIYVSCDGSNLQACINAGITEVPSVVYENKAYSGAKDIAWFEQLSGCKF